MFKKVVFLNILALLFVSGAYAQDSDESKVFVRVGVGLAFFANDGYTFDLPAGELHYHEAALTANFGMGFGTEYFRIIVLFDPAIIDGVRGTSINSVGIKGEIGLPKIKWLKLGGGIMNSHNYAKLSDDVRIYEKSDIDTLLSPFWSITFLPQSSGTGRFFADIRVGRSTGGDIISPQTGKPIADRYVSISLGVQLRFDNE
ncbi:MAG TPA: hypothetical protein VJC06_00610 [Candidatus Paceibacterota bacterium]